MTQRSEKLAARKAADAFSDAMFKRDREDAEDTRIWKEIEDSRLQAQHRLEQEMGVDE